MVRGSTHGLLVSLCALALGVACEEEKKPEVAEQAASAAAPTSEPEPAPEPEPTPSAAPEVVEVPAWVDDYAVALCKRVAVCREKMLGAVPPQQKMMLSMQIPTQEACLKNTRTFKKKAPKADLDDAEKKALAKCIRTVPTTACGNVQTGKVPECQTMVDLIAEAKGDEPAEGSGAEAP